MRLQHRIRLAWQALTSTELDDAIDTSLQAMMDAVNFQMLTGRTLSETNTALAFDEIEIKEKDA